MSPSIQPLIDERQLGSRLNLDLQHGDRADFRLWLSLLDERVEELPWLQRPTREQGDTRALRERFLLPPEQPLVDEGAADLSPWGECLQQGGSMSDIRLALALQPQPLKGKSALLEPEVYHNLSARAQCALAKDQSSLPPLEAKPPLLLAILDTLHGGELRARPLQAAA
ncbi:VC2046/SO_2500 family protein [Aeromonas diversa]|uniref:VC2046/SO_2500 family protein n=1 Tax=Aeromonas diversa TaxID=502790 RepID=UPI0039A0B3A1